VALIEHFESPADPYLCWQVLYEWTSPGTISQLSHPDLASGNYEGIDIDALMESGQAISTLVAEMSEPFRSVQASLGVKALHAIPVTIEGLLWGAICFDDCREAKQRSAAEISLLKIAAACVGSAIDRQARSELPALNWSTSMRGASKIKGNRLDSSRLTPILFWSYIASLSSNAGSQRQ
jgi:transcriptional regulator with GAF, ATPase, and Fis domain